MLQQMLQEESPALIEAPVVQVDSQVDSFKIPELPRGKTLRIELLSTWGDPHYIGLNGLDIFDHNGQLVVLSDVKSQIAAHPEDINVLEEYDDDPRKVSNLMDGTNLTCDDLHVWLAPFAAGAEHSITIQFDGVTTLSLLRIWNYNKSRTHSYRGVQALRATLDGLVIFEGDIQKAPGMLTEGAAKWCCSPWTRCCCN